MKLATNETGLFESSLITPIITTTDTHKQQVDEDLRPGSYFPSDTELW